MKALSLMVLVATATSLASAGMPPPIGGFSNSRIEIAAAPREIPALSLLPAAELALPFSVPYPVLVRTVVVARSPRRVDYKLVVKAPDTRFDYKLSIGKANPSIDPRILAEPSHLTK